MVFGIGTTSALRNKYIVDPGLRNRNIGVHDPGTLRNYTVPCVQEGLARMQFSVRTHSELFDGMHGGVQNDSR